MRARIKEGWYPYGVGLIVELCYVKVHGKISENLFEVIKVVDGQRKNYDLCVKKLKGKTIGKSDLDFNYDKNMRDTTKTFRVKIKGTHPNPEIRSKTAHVVLNQRLEFGDRYEIVSLDTDRGNVTLNETFYIMDEYLDFEITSYDGDDMDETDYLLSSQANREALEKSIEQANKGNVRHFDSGAIRDLDDEKEDYVECLSWSAMRRFGLYMKSKEKQYGPGNWKKGIPIKEYEKSLFRHVQKYFANKYEGANIEPETDHLAGIFFNLQGLIHEEEKLKKSE